MGKRRLKMSSSSSLEWSSSISDSELEEVKRKAQGDLDDFLAIESVGVLDVCLKPTSPKIDSVGTSLDSLLMPPPSPLAPRLAVQSREQDSKKEAQVPCSPGLGLKATVEEYLRSEDGEGGKETTEDSAESCS